MKPFPLYRQPENSMACGATCLRIIASFYGINYDLKSLLKITKTDESGTSLYDIKRAASSIGLKAKGVRIQPDRISPDILPCIAHVYSNHFVVIYHLTPRRIHVADPGHGKKSYTFDSFRDIFLFYGEKAGTLLLFKKA